LKFSSEKNNHPNIPLPKEEEKGKPTKWQKKGGEGKAKVI